MQNLIRIITYGPLGPSSASSYLWPPSPSTPATLSYIHRVLQASCLSHLGPTLTGVGAVQ